VSRFTFCRTGLWTAPVEERSAGIQTPALPGVGVEAYYKYVAQARHDKVTVRHTDVKKDDRILDIEV
jgi:hypothetical protein